MYVYLKEYRGAALGFFNWGVYLGYSMTYVLMYAERTLGWRAVYYICGIPGIVMAVVVLFAVKEPSRDSGAVKQVDNTRM